MGSTKWADRHEAGRRAAALLGPAYSACLDIGLSGLPGANNSADALSRPRLTGCPLLLLSLAADKAPLHARALVPYGGDNIFSSF
ncbi:MAG: hypothetical protein DU429_04415 [Candidatus Tokpelaia sp.]|nr:MAG: hypothetical protein DU430_05970 [Candidatus Tokpelaia sp.]KAA6207091.1 MAG: hypothetical protein DU429_04415 [Candidatus Tokpelaia sp.]